MESGLRAAATQLENRQQRLVLQLLRLPHGGQAREVVGAPTEIGRRLTNALAYARRTESTVLPEEPENLDAESLQEEEAEAKEEAEKRDQDSPCSLMGYGSAVGRRGTRWCGRGA